MSDRAAPTGPAEPDLEIVETRVYRGPNVFSNEPAIHLLVDLGSLEDHPTDTIPGFVDGLLELLPGLADHSCSRGRKGGFVERLREGTWLGHVTEHVALQLRFGQRHQAVKPLAHVGWLGAEINPDGQRQAQHARASTTSSTARSAA